LEKNIWWIFFKKIRTLSFVWEAFSPSFSLQLGLESGVSLVCLSSVSRVSLVCLSCLSCGGVRLSLVFLCRAMLAQGLDVSDMDLDPWPDGVEPSDAGAKSFFAHIAPKGPPTPIVGVKSTFLALNRSPL
jgi:hypothetical protein